MHDFEVLEIPIDALIKIPRIFDLVTVFRNRSHSAKFMVWLQGPGIGLPYFSEHIGI